MTCAPKNPARRPPHSSTGTYFFTNPVFLSAPPSEPSWWSVCWCFRISTLAEPRPMGRPALCPRDCATAGKKYDGIITCLVEKIHPTLSRHQSWPIGARHKQLQSSESERYQHLPNHQPNKRNSPEREREKKKEDANPSSFSFGPRFASVLRVQHDQPSDQIEPESISPPSLQPQPNPSTPRIAYSQILDPGRSPPPLTLPPPPEQ